MEDLEESGKERAAATLSQQGRRWGGIEASRGGKGMSCCSKVAELVEEIEELA